jgi:hypothetical protein
MIRRDEGGRLALDHRGAPGAERHPVMSVMQSHGRLILYGAGAVGGAALIHHELRPYLHPGLHQDVPRDHAELDNDRAFVRAHDADFHTTNVYDFTPPELVLWRSGYWHNEWHYGRYGWWWEANGVWYPYEAPVYPYPVVVAPLQVYDVTTVDHPQPVVATAPVDGGDPSAVGGNPPGGAPAGTTVMASITIPPLPAVPQGFYRCSSPSGFFPSVESCPSNWAFEDVALPQAAK